VFPIALGPAEMNDGNFLTRNHCHKRMWQKTLLLLLLTVLPYCGSLCLAYGQQGAITLPRNLADLTNGADKIVQGRVVSARVEPHPTYRNLKTVLITLEVEDALKGGSIKTLTFRQFIWDIRDVSNACGYRTGDEVLLFLNRPTSLGLTSPVGLEQGHFRIAHDRNGELVATSGSSNAGLLGDLVKSGTLPTSKLSPLSRTTVQNYKQGSISLSALKESVHVLLQNQQVAR